MSSTEAQLEDHGLVAVSGFSGIGGLDLGVELGGVPVVAHCESVPYRRRVLAARFPGVPIYPDIRTLDPAVLTDPWAGGQLADESPGQGNNAGDHVKRRRRNGKGQRPVPRRRVIFIGGFPCQDLSVAGKRKGLGGGRSGLYWEIVRLITDAAVRPEFVLLENVPGLLSSCSCRGCRKCGVLLRWHSRRGCPGAPDADGADAGDGSGALGAWVAAGGCRACNAAKAIRKRHAGTDFAVVCAALANLGYRVEYRILDSRYLGVAQRRRRVFIFAELNPRADGEPSVLLEPEGGAGDPLACREAWPGSAVALAGGARGGGQERPGDGRADEGTGPVASHDVAPPLLSLTEGAGHRSTEDAAAYVVDEVAATLKSRTGNGKTGVGTRTTDADQSFVVEPASEEAATLTKGSSSEGVSYPGRRKEDDENLVVESPEEPQTFDWQVGGATDKTWGGKSRIWMEDKPGTARALTKQKTLAVYVPGSEPVAFQQTPQGDLNEDPDGAVPPLLGREAHGVGNNSPLIALPEEPVAFDWTGDDPGNTPRGETPPLSAGHAGEIAVGFIPATGEHAGTVGAEDEIAPTLAAGRGWSSRAAAVYTKTHGAQDVGDHELWDEAADARTLNGMGYATDVVVEGADKPPVRAGAAVRRLTPRECERLQGLPDDWTLLEPNTPDGPRYAAIGDSVTVNVPQWVIARLVRRERLR